MLKPASNQFYRVRSDDERYPGQWFLDYPISMGGQAIDPREFTSGKPYKGPRPTALQIRNTGEEIAFSLAAFDMPIVSDPVAKTLARMCCSEIELFSVEIPRSRGNFAILNVIHSLACLDEARSEFTRWQPGDHRPDLVGQYHWVSKIRIDPGLTEDSHIFRIVGWQIALIVSQPLKEKLEAIPRLGVLFECVS